VRVPDRAEARRASGSGEVSPPHVSTGRTLVHAEQLGYLGESCETLGLVLAERIERFLAQVPATG